MLLALSCKKVFAPIAVSSPDSYLVIEGVINSGSDSTYFRLSRTVKLSAKDTVKFEDNAAVSIEGSDNTSYQLNETVNGVYATPALGLSPTAKYRLRVKTANNEEYLSDYVETKSTPPIDSITYTVENDGVQFYVTTHDPANATRYYRWDFEETWGYLAFEQSFYKIGTDGLPEYRTDPADKFYECFKTVPSQQVLLGNSLKLAQDVVDKQPLDFITAESGKISHGYSVLFHQYALTQDAYTYWQQLKKNTETIGSIFDAQPSEVASNIHCISDPSQAAIGYISASTVTAQRIFVDARSTVVVTPGYLPPPTPDDCTSPPVAGQIWINPEDTFLVRLQQLTYTGNTLLIAAITDRPTGKLIGYTYSSRECTDCLAKAPYGTNAVPAFWPAGYHY
jgi:hypothetical protein